MTLAIAASIPMAQSHDKRRHPRYVVRLQGRYMLADRREFPCTVIDVSEGGIAVTGPERGAVGEGVIVYIDQLGRVQGNIVRHTELGFAISLTGTTAALARYSERLHRIWERDRSAEPERRREVRIEPADLTTLISLADGRNCEVVDLSLSGADVRIDPRPPIGAVLELGQLRARVVRHSEAGVGVEFEDGGNQPMTLADRFRLLLLPGSAAATSQRAATDRR
jgi:hypothetical protein